MFSSLFVVGLAASSVLALPSTVTRQTASPCDVGGPTFGNGGPYTLAAINKTDVGLDVPGIRLVFSPPVGTISSSRRSLAKLQGTRLFVSLPDSGMSALLATGLRRPLKLGAPFVAHSATVIRTVQFLGGARNNSYVVVKSSSPLVITLHIFPNPPRPQVPSSSARSQRQSTRWDCWLEAPPSPFDFTGCLRQGALLLVRWILGLALSGWHYVPVYSGAFRFYVLFVHTLVLWTLWAGGRRNFRLVLWAQSSGFLSLCFAVVDVSSCSLSVVVICLCR
ncbi:hypothetical protein OH76DRAFT_1474154 [Lentinus brumalis]|uniref:Uncharacterized protein n=1 Tax=Lentinus brumalis TaxID=2498619 RepID=A0A371CXD3_9APHY|nr:hypothetical protein OH76DRAFT_1474154 [Polyporus brumalis]